MCKHRTDQSTHTASGFYGTDTIYCVYCIHEKYSLIDPCTIAIDKFDLGRPVDTWGDYFINRDDHESRIQYADMNYPIFITSNYEVIDGCHRIHHALRANDIYIQAIVLSKNDLEECVFNE